MSVVPTPLSYKGNEKDKRVWMCEYERSIGMTIGSTEGVMVSTPVVASPTTTRIMNDSVKQRSDEAGRHSGCGLRAQEEQMESVGEHTSSGVAK